MKLVNPYRLGGGGGGGPTTYVEDTFTEASTTLLHLHTPDTDVQGGGWNKLSGAAEVKLNEMLGNAVGKYTIDAGVADCVLRYDTRHAGSIASNESGLLMRAPSTSNAFGVLSRASDGRVRLVRWTGGSLTELDSYTIASFSNTQTYAFEVTLSGNDISVKIDGTERLSATDSQNNTDTNHGFAPYSPIRYDNFTIKSE